MNANVEEPGTALAELRSSLHGSVLAAGDEEYEQARRVWNGTIDRRPDAVVRCSGPGDVVAALRFARSARLEVAVRGGGHSLPGFSASEGGVVIDLSPMRGVKVDVEARTAIVGGGATWGDFDLATHAYGLAAPGGLVSTTGVGGLTLGGGIGWLTRKYGLACDNLLGAEVVLASGEIVTSSFADKPDLLWALRGGGGNFGVVTSFTFALHPVDVVTAGFLLFEMTRFDEVMRAYSGYCGAFSDDFSTMPVVMTAPDQDGVPGALRGAPALGIAGCHCGPAQEAEGELAPLRGLTPAADFFHAIPYPDLQRMFDADLPPGDRYYFKGGFVDDWNDELATIVKRNMAAKPSARDEFDLHHMGGAASRVPDSASPFPGRRAAFIYNVIAAWSSSSDDDANRGWARQFAADLEAAGGHPGYGNFLSDAGSPEALLNSEVKQRLVDLKRRYDPENVFHLNHNIAAG
ncbi:MAG: FAD-binding oxidoreductase [Candidatus Dormibacteria bacterium]